MFRLWGKLIKNSKIIKSHTAVRPEDDTRTHKVFSSIEELCKLWDLAVPIWLEANINEFKRLGKTRFYSDSFIEDVDFDFMEIQIIEES